MSRITFILGAPRSGTTLLRVMLAGHPELFAPPEMVIAPFATMAEREASLKTRYWEKGGLRRAFMEIRGIDVDAAKGLVASLSDRSIPEVFAMLQHEIGVDRILVDKCPHLAMPGPGLQRLGEWFPDARFIWIVRNPASVTRSLANMPMAEVMLTGYSGGVNSVWHIANDHIQQFLAGVPKARWTMVRYEDLVTDEAELSLRRAAQAIGVSFHKNMLQPYKGDRMRTGPKGARAIGDPNMAGRGKIQPELATKWFAGFDHRTMSAHTKQLALSLGYDLEAIELPEITKVSTALESLLNKVKELEATIDNAQDIDALEGRRFLMRMLSASVDVFTEHDDAEHPRFHHAEGPTRKMFADCPDTDYHRAPLIMGPGRVYRLTGVVPSGTTYVGVLLYGKGGRCCGRLPDTDMNIDADGRFEVLIATEPQLGTWLQADDDVNATIVRQYFADRATQTPISIQIERVGATASTGLDLDRYAVGLHRAERMMNAVFGRTLRAFKMVSGMALNQFVQIPGDSLFPTPDNTYQVCWYRFGQDQVMLVRGRLPQARYFGLSLCNAWMESLDYQRHTVNLNHAQLQTDDDGSFEICLAHSDPGHPNWLDTTGHHSGYLLSRSLLLDGQAPAYSIQVMYDHEWQAKKARRG
ncbi:MAG: hypothetical protein ACI9MC_001268 [Kiritimatiellia bacterium]|jgi:hypothetical protein